MKQTLSRQEFFLLMRRHKLRVERRLAQMPLRREPSFVYAPIRYAMSSGGKRLRAVLVLLASEAVGGKPAAALDAAVAIELLHNFTLVHDDLMDNADMRRGKPTVRKKWNIDVAILAGDQMIAYAYASLLKTKTHRLQDILNVFTHAFIEVCDGQGFDKEFEHKHSTSVQEYLNMIDKKTARIISAATEIGALVGGGTSREVKLLRTFGRELGMAFQMKDDLLDAAGNEEEFGKSIGGDIREGKKTYLLLKALERAKGNDKKLLQEVTTKKGMTTTNVKRILDIYKHIGILDDTQRAIGQRTQRAQKSLSGLQQSRANSSLQLLSSELLERSS